MTVHTISLEQQVVPAGQQCQATMHGGKGWRKRGYLSIKVGKWSKPCPNRAVGSVNGLWVCEAHGGRYVVIQEPDNKYVKWPAESLESPD